MIFMAYGDELAKWLSTKQVTPEVATQMSEIQRKLQELLLDCVAELTAAEQMVRNGRDFVNFYNGIDRLAVTSRRLSYATHYFKTFCDWQVKPVPEFNEHFINLFYLMPRLRRTFWLEGAVMCGLGIEPGGRILELCCGSGFYTDLFYSPFASEIVAVDFDPRAIEFARTFHARDNVRYEIVDIRSELPPGPFDTVIWDGAIEHFTADEVGIILARARQVSVNNVLLLGYTVAEESTAPEHPEHEQHFHGIDDLAALLKKSFENVRVFERIHPTMEPHRHNLFFYASDGPLPFDPGWGHGRRI
jgi:SAM-dependent methyltransferase